jgi:hypothetical protein
MATLGNRDQVMLYLGRLWWQKGLDILPEAWKEGNWTTIDLLLTGLITVVIRRN